jgi:hypothetical protein
MTQEINPQDVPQGVDPAALEQRTRELAVSMPWSNALRVARRELLKSTKPGLTGKALERAANGEPMEEQVRKAKEAQMEATAAEQKTRGPDPESDRTRAVNAALDVLKRAKDPLKTKDIDERVAKAGVEMKGVFKPSVHVADAAREGREVNGYRFVKAARATYGVEKVS